MRDPCAFSLWFQTMQINYFFEHENFNLKFKLEIIMCMQLFCFEYVPISCPFSSIAKGQNQNEREILKEI